MVRRLGIILATTLVALLVMTDGAWACRCMNRLVNRCGHRRACCCICVQPACCQPVCCQPACCQPVGSEVKLQGPTLNVSPAPNISNPPLAPEPDVKPIPSPTPKPPVKVDNPWEKKSSDDVKTLRMWTDASGKYQVEAHFVSFQDGAVRLQRANGRYVRIACDLLCAADKDFVLHQDQRVLAMQ